MHDHIGVVVAQRFLVVLAEHKGAGGDDNQTDDAGQGKAQAEQVFQKFLADEQKEHDPLRKAVR